MKFLENIINMKINSISGKELLKYAKQFNIQVTSQQAEQVAAYLRGRNINIFNSSDRAKVIKEIAKIAGPDTAKKVNQLFLMLTK
ncbi:DUF2624 domain-containing protein [Caldibacillus lycopersici]|uniref:DUF2624 domain-containing protein n=1 Tax=Perspicuibacillus lycopersici TaxID=1325689 RepID=A0AAE3IV07_9BACI|nr:DUF2624 domain-containing protein [Perspicuibacillus lycopersici]MCU9613896.1 DUF2624 domain-containing protein [Perspicuibacillus lycopersici]